MLCTARKTRHYLRRLNTLTCNEVESWFGLTDWLVGPRLSLTVSTRGPPATSNTCLDFLRTLCWAETKKEHYWLGPVYISIIFLLLCFQVCSPSILNALSLPLCLYEWNEKVCEIPPKKPPKSSSCSFWTSSITWECSFTCKWCKSKKKMQNVWMPVTTS